MKMRLLKQLFFVFLIVLVSCDNEPVFITDVAVTQDRDDEGEEEGLSIIGDWLLTEFSLTEGIAYYQLQGQELSTSLTSYGRDFDYLVTFYEDGHLSPLGTFIQVFEFDLLGQSQNYQYTVTSTEADDEVGFFSGAWIQDDDELIVTNDSGTHVLKIKGHTEDRLEISKPIEQIITIQGLEVRITGTVEAVLSR